MMLTQYTKYRSREANRDITVIFYYYRAIYQL